MMALHRLLADPEVNVQGLMSAFRGREEVISLHNTPKSLIKAQACALDLPLYGIHLSPNALNSEYEQKHLACFEQLNKAGIDEVAFGDIHLEPIKTYRDQLLAKSQVKGCYPLWHADPKELFKEFIALGYLSMVTAIDLINVPEEILGQTLSFEIADKLESLNLDACGENGEYHSFVYEGPPFQYPLHLNKEATTETDYRPAIEMHLRAYQLATR